MGRLGSILQYTVKSQTGSVRHRRLQNTLQYTVKYRLDQCVIADYRTSEGHRGARAFEQRENVMILPAVHVYCHSPCSGNDVVQ